MWLAGIAIAGALIGSGCPGRGTTGTGEPQGKPDTGVPPAQNPPCPSAPKPGRICDSPFVIVEPEKADCEAELRGGWKLYPRRQVRYKTAPSDKQPAVAPNTPRRSTPLSKPFCVYEWKGTSRPKPDDLLQIHGTQECALAVGMAADAGAADAGAANPGGPNPAVERPFFSRNFDRQVKAIASPVPPALQKPDKNAPLVAVLDASPWGVTKKDDSGHGYAMNRIIGHLSCVGGADAPDCGDFVRPYVALPRIFKNGKWEPGPNGGFIGYFHDLFDAFEQALDERPKDRRLIVNLSLGWDPVMTVPDGPEERRMRELLERAYCEGVLVIGAAGNGTMTSQAPVFPAALESAGPGPDAKRCRDVLGIRDPRPPASGYSPLIHSVGSVDLFDERLPTMRAWAHPRLAAYGMAATVPGPGSGEYFDPTTGTSASAAAVSGMAAVVWRLKPRLDAAQVMAAVYKGGVPLETTYSKSRTEYCVDTAHDRCRSWLPRRPTLCGAVKAVLGGPISCVTPAHPDRDDPATAGTFFPPPPTSSQPPVLNAPCDTTNCSVPIGISPAQAIGAVGPMGVATCGECRVLIGGGNGSLAGSLDFTNVPTGGFDTTVVLYDHNWSPHYYHPFLLSHPNGGFTQGLPANSTSDVIAGAIYWTYESGGISLTDAASLQISP
jgi:hypothetical protein